MIKLTTGEARYILDVLDGISDMISDNNYDDIAVISDEIEEATKILNACIEYMEKDNEQEA